MMSMGSGGGAVYHVKFITCLDNLLFLNSISIAHFWGWGCVGWGGGGVIYFSFSFCFDSNLEATVVKTDKIRGSKQLFTPCFLLIGIFFFFKIIINNYRISHQKNHAKNNNDQTFT